MDPASHDVYILAIHTTNFRLPLHVTMKPASMKLAKFVATSPLQSDSAALFPSSPFQLVILPVKHLKQPEKKNQGSNDKL